MLKNPPGTARKAKPERKVRGVRLQTLVRLRWLAVLGQLAAVLFVSLVLGLPMPFWTALMIIAATAWVNIILTLRWRTTARLNESHAAMLLAFDIFQLAALIYLTGGLENPFSFLFLVPVTISATILPSSRTLILGGLALALITLLAFFHRPLPWWPGEQFVAPPLFVWGMWVALVLGMAFTALYVHRIAREAREMADALAAAELALARQQQLYALDGLAAAAAHELGTPLATIALVSKELRRECSGVACDTAKAGLCEDLDLLVSQAERCRDILTRLAHHGTQSDAMLARVRLSVMLEEIIEPLRGPDVEVRLLINAHSGADGKPVAEPVIPRNPGILYGLGNIAENAGDFADSTVTVEAEWDEAEIAVTIADDGPGFPEEIMDRLGEPYVTTRGGYYASTEEERESRDLPQAGMGLGFFIAKTLLERTGAVLGLANRPAPEHGAIVRVAWPRQLLEVAGAGRET